MYNVFGATLISNFPNEGRCSERVNHSKTVGELLKEAPQLLLLLSKDRLLQNGHSLGYPLCKTVSCAV